MKLKNDIMPAPDVFVDIKKYIEKRLKIKLSNPISIKQHWDEDNTISVGFSKIPEHMRKNLNDFILEDFKIYISRKNNKVWCSKLEIETTETQKHHYYVCDMGEIMHSISA